MNRVEAWLVKNKENHLYHIYDVAWWWTHGEKMQPRRRATAGETTSRPHHDIVIRVPDTVWAICHLASKYLKTGYKIRMWAVKNSINEQSRSWTLHNRVSLNPWCVSAVYSLGNESHNHWVLFHREWRKMQRREEDLKNISASVYVTDWAMYPIGILHCFVSVYKL